MMNVEARDVSKVCKKKCSKPFSYLVVSRVHPHGIYRFKYTHVHHVLKDTHDDACVASKPKIRSLTSSPSLSPFSLFAAGAAALTCGPENRFLRTSAVVVVVVCRPSFHQTRDAVRGLATHMATTPAHTKPSRRRSRDRRSVQRLWWWWWWWM